MFYTAPIWWLSAFASRPLLSLSAHLTAAIFAFDTGCLPSNLRSSPTPNHSCTHTDVQTHIYNWTFRNFGLTQLRFGMGGGGGIVMYFCELQRKKTNMQDECVFACVSVTAVVYYSQFSAFPFKQLWRGQPIFSAHSGTGPALLLRDLFSPPSSSIIHEPPSLLANGWL